MAMGVVLDWRRAGRRLRGRRRSVCGRRSGRGRGTASRARSMCAVSSMMAMRGQVVALADGEVVGVVRGRDLDGAGAELGVGPVVGEDGDFAVWLPDGGERERDELADEVLCSARRSGSRRRRRRRAWFRGAWWRRRWSRCRRRRDSGCGRACRRALRGSTSRSETAVWHARGPS